MTPLISIIIPVYKVENYLNRCINSVLGQTYKNIEVVLVDDGSPDACPQMCDDWAKKDNRIRVVHKENGGLSSARNRGLDLCKGEYIAFVDSDDWIEADTIEYLYKQITSDDYDFASIEMEITKGTNKTQLRPEKITVCNQDELLDVFFRVKSNNINYCVCDKLYKKELLKSTRFWEGMLFEDIYFNFQLIEKVDKVIMSNQIKYHWFFNNGSITRRGITERDLDFLIIWEKICDECAEKYPNKRYYSEMNYLRGEMGLIGKELKFGVSKSFTKWNDTKKTFIASLRKNYFKLIKWKMPISRKILLTAICIAPNPTSFVFGVFRKILS